MMPRLKMGMAILFFCASLLSITVAVPSFATTIVLDGLTEEQRAQLALQAAQMKQQKDEMKVEKINTWVDLGKNIGLTFASAAKEIGVAADEFLKSTAGKITLIIIVWKTIGNDLFHIFFGSMFLLVFISLWIYFFRRMCVFKSKTVEYPAESRFKKIKRFEYYGVDDESMNITRRSMLAVLILIVFVGVVAAFSF